MCAHWTSQPTKLKQKKIPQITLAQETEEGGNRDKSMKRILKDRENNTIIREAISEAQTVKFKNSAPLGKTFTLIGSI